MSLLADLDDETALSERDPRATRNVAPGPWPILDHLTASVPIRLLTPRSAQQALALLGLDWAARHREHTPAAEERVSAPGLYAWVHRSVATNPLDGGVLYWGIGRGAGGVDGRLDYEFSAARPAFDHGHGLAVGRLQATPLRAAVLLAPRASRTTARTALFDGLDLPPHGREKIDAFLNALTSGSQTRVDLALVEWFVIRLSIQVGQTGPPVQSQHATAWANTSGADWTAYAVRRIWERGLYDRP